MDVLVPRHSIHGRPEYHDQKNLDMALLRSMKSTGFVT